MFFNTAAIAAILKRIFAGVIPARQVSVFKAHQRSHSLAEGVKFVRYVKAV